MRTYYILIISFLLVTSFSFGQDLSNLRQVTSTYNATYFAQLGEISGFLALDKKGSLEKNPKLFQLYFDNDVILNAKLAPGLRPQPKNPNATVGYQKMYGQNVISMVNFPPYSYISCNYNEDFSEIDTIFQKSGQLLNQLNYENDLLTSYSSNWGATNGDFLLRQIWPDKFADKKEWQRTKTKIIYDEAERVSKIIKTIDKVRADNIALIDTATLQQSFKIIEFNYDTIIHKMTRIQYSLLGSDTSKQNVILEYLTIAKPDERELRTVKHGKSTYDFSLFNSRNRPLVQFSGADSLSVNYRTSYVYDSISGCTVEVIYQKLNFKEGYAGIEKKITKYGLGPKFDLASKKYTSDEAWRVIELTEVVKGKTKVLGIDNVEIGSYYAYDKWCQHYYRYKKR